MDGLRGMIAHTLTIDRAVWDGLEEVPPGTVITVDRSGIHRRRYWCLAATPHEHDLPKTVDTVRDLLAEIVERQLVADVPVSVLLSGGLDSSTLAALAAGLLRESGSKAQTYAVDFAEHAAGYVAELERPSRDAPFVREMVDRLGTVHRDVLLDAGAVSDPDLRARAVAAYDLPPASQDRDRSMLLLFREVSRLSTVALSGEGADEVFGGYSWRHDPQVWRAPAFPWIAGLTGYGQLRTVLRPELLAGLRMDDYLGDLYARAVGEVDRLPGDDPHAYRMRVLSHLELTCSLRALLARKDRLSMATGLEIRVPYCDHRLVAYVHSVPWAMQTFDGREKSLLRAAAADLLPASVLRRTKSAYPSLFDVDPLLAEARVLLGERTEPVFDLVDRDWLVRTTRRAPRGLGRADRNGLEDVLNLAAWMRAYTPELRV
jgi:asparagine synthase (glutamine-hydrolysing)